MGSMMKIRSTDQPIQPCWQLRWGRAAALALGLLAPLAQANLVQNGSFELTTATTTSAFNSVTVNNWSNSNIGEAIVLPSWFTNGYLFPGVTFDAPVPQTSPDGGNFVFSDGNYMNSPLVQTISGLVPNGVYQLSFYQGLAQDKEIYTTPGVVTGYWQVSLGSSTLNSAFMKANGTNAGPGSATMSPWNLQTLVFTAQNATELLSFVSVGTGDPPLVLLDGVSLVAVPEPGTLALLTLGGVLVAGAYRRTRWERLTSA
jgi:hypothetical protein